MSLITNKQQELINTSISEYIKTHDKISQQYLFTRHQILKLCQEIITKGITPNDHISIKKLQYELDTTWEIYKNHLQSIQNIVDVKSNISKPYVSKLNSEYESLLKSKLNMNNSIRNMKQVQLPLLQQIKGLQKSFEKNLNRQSARRFRNKESVKKQLESPNDGDISIESNMIEEEEVFELLAQFDAKVEDVNTVADLHDVQYPDSLGGGNLEHIEASHPIKSGPYVRKELEESNKFIPMDDNKYVFDVSKLSFNNSQLVTSSIDQFDELTDQLENDIADLIEQGTMAKANWMFNADKVISFNKIYEG